mmetsp:Transcript_36123/g.86118  ORF Transcript_36123/g.86118 Transcript_36123/m.86118 type:complete len:88 (+) Transcript_36123:1994-2257(+)
MIIFTRSSSQTKQVFSSPENVRAVIDFERDRDLPPKAISALRSLRTPTLKELDILLSLSSVIVPIARKNAHVRYDKETGKSNVLCVL